MIIFRRILFYLFTLAYLIICPALILYSLGIIFKPTTQSLEKTGVIYISTVPSDADIYINKKLFKDHTPALISGLLPGNYLLHVTKEGYNDWQKIIPVREQKSTSLENV